MTSKTVLYVDHDLSRVEWFNQQVKPELDVETAFNGWDGVGAAIMYHPNLVVFNLGISVMTGLEAIRLIRSEESLKELPFLGFTIPRDKFLEEACMNEGCTTILEDLSDGLSSILKKHL
ncbi:MAG: hypothetical protein QF560_15525 [SAR324 cluster bacterium]|jgi:CheY-like chemotaxis protein|nr:hypothetical protein [Deltaproteobacteria bacterium]MAE00584.1 hypothetical protein [Pseudomonadota bacterium]MDP6092436.1 hypothetical protein [SAR324 cluster bacterium]MBI12067.1 hypothetical protein [Deltaproteobacteria bacterium]MBP43447.1 hypothetical protein [Deltaproteobacteria bacterium]|tara:strand:+ start:2618 stop:2974 length:357 start_codon:yes stop_codon:yes gene_type:complete